MLMATSWQTNGTIHVQSENENKCILNSYHMGYKYQKHYTGEGLIKSKNLFLKILIFSEFLGSRLSLFHSTIEEGKKSF